MLPFNTHHSKSAKPNTIGHQYFMTEQSKANTRARNFQRTNDNIKFLKIVAISILSSILFLGAL